MCTELANCTSSAKQCVQQGKYRNFGAGGDAGAAPEEQALGREHRGEWRGSELPVQSECSLSLTAQPCCAWSPWPNSYCTQWEQETSLSLCPSWGQPSLKGCIPGSALILFRLHSNRQCLLQSLRSDLCRYPQLLFSLISVAVVKRCCNSTKDLLTCTFAPFAIRYFFLTEILRGFCKKVFFQSLIICVVSSYTKS